jgi:hypothetical protein
VSGQGYHRRRRARRRGSQRSCSTGWFNCKLGLDQFYNSHDEQYQSGRQEDDQEDETPFFHGFPGYGLVFPRPANYTHSAATSGPCLLSWLFCRAPPFRQRIIRLREKLFPQTLFLPVAGRDLYQRCNLMIILSTYVLTCLSKVKIIIHANGRLRVVFVRLFRAYL